MRKLLVFVLLLGLVTGCAARKPSGFLGDNSQYEQLQEDPEVSNAKLWRKPGMGALADNYTAVMIAPVKLLISKEVQEDNDLTPEELEMLKTFFHDALVRELGKVVTVVDNAGPEVLTLELAITNVKETPKVMNAVSSVLPVGVAITFVSKAVTGEHRNVGETVIEAKARDSVSGEVVATFSEVNTGNKYSLYNYERLGQVKNAIDEWAENMRDRLESKRNIAAAE
ncbi:DUF3313 domain-containing protein [Halodesulfovibrio spirochaetisodalis]|uniref:Lipoprotein n=1 Tax=Halodesulfovibrio spirochaetisodalis TaxID=1560234 RepID=A0A1B7XQ64_9BACT|nr:DUF3313 domain-containing protein [Halodesulfovibrio spirochaetisodalis]OBQ57633.1 hypothetical protein SP90_00930 [Halodesulfovibrio spirochaetisodalis]